jgi:hypothetical protein
MNNNIYPVIVSIIKQEHKYIEEFVKYHLALGFKHICIYDNEDEPNTYDKILESYKNYITIIHIPTPKTININTQLAILNHFQNVILKYNDYITHATHIDIDEFIVLKKHNNICDFIIDYIKNDCGGIGMNWRFFGSSGHKIPTNEPVTIRFTKCQEKANNHIKSLYDVKKAVGFLGTMHLVFLNDGYHVKSTNGDIITKPYNDNPVIDVIQLNHYKCKTKYEFLITRQRGRADTNNTDDYLEYISIDYDKVFNNFDLNDVEDLTAKTFYENILVIK